jgi:hypothetical protein
MNNSNKIDYNSKVMNFMAMTETGDPEVATKYLESAGWDETVAVNNFFSKIKVNNNFNDNNNIMQDDFQNNNILNRNLINNNKTNNNNNNQENEGFFSRYFISPIRALLGACSEKREIELDEEERVFHLLPNKIHDSNRFCQLIKRKIGIIIFYTGNNVQFLNTFINQLSHSAYLINFIKKYFFIYPLLASTNEGYRMQSVISDNQLLYPAFVFCYNGSNNQRGDFTDLIFGRNHIINILEGESINMETFNNALMDSSEKVGFYSNVNNGSSPMTDGEVLEQQKSDMEALEKQVQKREEELKKQKMLEEQRIKEEELKKKEMEKKANEAKKKIVEEPSEGDPNVTTICFRYPDGQQRKDRRFLKSHTIQNLYDFVTSLGKEIYTEEENNNFSLYQPFPPKKYEEMNNTLEQEGLFPNAVIQIREE